MGSCLPCKQLRAVTDEQESDHEYAEFHNEHGTRPEEWRMWLPASAECRKAFNEVVRRMNDYMEAVAKESGAKWKGFEIEQPRVDQYFLAGPKIGPKAATRNGTASMEVKKLAGVSEHGTEAWEKSTGVDISTYTQLPWVSLQKARKRAKVKKITKKTSAKGLKALEVTAIKVSQEKIYSAATRGSQQVKHQSLLTIAIEGTPDAISKTVHHLKLEEFKNLALLNPDAESGLYALNVSYPRLLSLASMHT